MSMVWEKAEGLWGRTPLSPERKHHQVGCIDFGHNLGSNHVDCGTGVVRHIRIQKTAGV